MTKTRNETTEKLSRYWQFHIERWAATGLTQTEYCKRNELSRDRFTYWKRKFKRQNLSVEFVQVPAPVHIRQTGLKLTLSQGLQIEIPDGFTSETLKKVLVTLRAVL